MNMQSSSNKEIKDKNLTIIKDQLAHEALMNQKYCEYASQVTDPELKSLMECACGVHKTNFMNLKNYLETHH